MSGEACCQNPPTGSGSGGMGQVEDIGGLMAYVVNHSQQSNIAIILISDIFGYEAPLLRKLADKLATILGFYVIVPDFFYGDPFQGGMSFQLLPAWNNLHRQAKGYEDAKLIISALKNKGISTVGAAGFCWGGKVVADLAKSELIAAAVLLHPYLVTAEDVQEVKSPIAILGAEFDEVTPVELIKQFEEVLASRTQVKSYVKIFEGAPHGWTVRYDEEDATSVKPAEESHQIMIDWFKHYLK